MNGGDGLRHFFSRRRSSPSERSLVENSASMGGPTVTTGNGSQQNITR